MPRDRHEHTQTGREGEAKTAQLSGETEKDKEEEKNGG